MTNNEIMKYLESTVRRYKDAKHHVSCIVDINILKETLDTIKEQKADIERLENDLEQHTFYDANNDDYYDNLVSNAKSEVMKEFAEKIDKLLERYSHIHEDAEIAMQDEIECDNETIEMQSVWDVHTLIRYEMGSEPEEMNRLQDNIETIAKERLLKEIEKDFRLFIKEMTEENK